MRPWPSKCSEGSPPLGTPAGFMFKNYGLPTCTFLTKWAEKTKGNSELQWPLWVAFSLPKLIFFYKTKLEVHGFKIKQNKWYIYFYWYLEASKYTQNSKITSLQDTVSKLAETTEKLEKNKMTGTSLEFQWLRLRASNAGGAGLMPGWGAKIPHPTCCMVWPKKKKREREKNKMTSENSYSLCSPPPGSLSQGPSCVSSLPALSQTPPCALAPPPMPLSSFLCENQPL